jgi:hypothetical protein
LCSEEDLCHATTATWSKLQGALADKATEFDSLMVYLVSSSALPQASSHPTTTHPVVMMLKKLLVTGGLAPI